MRGRDLTGQTFGRLTVLSFVGSIKGHPTWDCSCSCGNTLRCTSGRLTSGNTKSCGCIKREVTGRLNLSHGCSRVGKRTPEYETWKSMVKRCTNPNDKFYHRYGGRGIRVCERWLGDGGFERFLADVGHRPSKSHSLDRFPNGDGDYEPGNVRWATPTEQGRNTSRNRILEYNGERRCVTEWAEVTGIPFRALHMRVQRGWSAERALTTPVRPLKRAVAAC